jgi:putative transcriptional regulator
MVGPGIQWARVLIPDDPAAKVVLLRAVSGTALPSHTHTGMEYTCILQGAFQDGDRHMQIGDLSECDEREHHQPVVNSDEPCVCVLAVDGKLVMEGWLARLAQRIVGL